MRMIRLNTDWRSIGLSSPTENATGTVAHCDDSSTSSASFWRSYRSTNELTNRLRMKSMRCCVTGPRNELKVSTCTDSYALEECATVAALVA